MKKQTSAGGKAGKNDRAEKHPAGALVPTASASPEQHSQVEAAPLPVAGIVASAGGLSALKQFFTALPSKSGIAFIIVPHLDPNHESLMTDLLSRYTQMPVAEATHGLCLRADHVYVIPPGSDLSLEANVLALSEPPKSRGHHIAIDFFLRSLALACGERAIGIVMSGTGSHGTLGLQAVKGSGGLAMVQDPDTAEFDQMPRNAVMTGIVDYILPVEAMPEALRDYAEHIRRGAIVPAESDSGLADADDLNQVLALLRSHSNYDFGHYRKNMLLRRVRRRMDLSHCEYIGQYLERLRDNDEEIQRLYRDLLIGVTGFFRDPEAFQAIERQVVETMVAQVAHEDAVRVWVPGCATGEEAYSLAILLLENLLRLEDPAKLQVFATDIDSRALDAARRGVYPVNIADDISAERLARFFVRVDEHHYQVSKQLREAVVFAPQNLLSDVPFSSLDLVSCRNVLIYLEPEVQRKIIALFHFALRPGGHLLLGNSETVGRELDLFETVSKKWRLFRRIGPPRRGLSGFPIAPGSQAQLSRRVMMEQSLPSQQHFAELIQRMVLEVLSAAAVLINRKHEILYSFGLTEKYLEIPAGEPTRDLLIWCRRGLRSRLRATCHTVIKNGVPVTLDNAQVLREGRYCPVTLAVQRVEESQSGEDLLLVMFYGRVVSGGADIDESQSGEHDESPLLQQLEYELKVARQDSQINIEDLETTNEELKASNEEVMSMNEELQSSNEELQTSKEELQSLNEELVTVNSQLQDKLEELEKANSDISNLLYCTNIATLFLDNELRIKRFTPAIRELLNILPADLGRSVSDFSANFTDSGLSEDAHRVMASLSPLEQVIVDRRGRSFLQRIHPYRTVDNRIEGVVVTFVDISEQIAAESESRLLATVLQDSNDAVIVLDVDGSIRNWNRGAEKIYGYGKGEAVAMNTLDMVPEKSRAMLRETLQRISSGDLVDPLEVQRKTRDGRVLNIWLTATRLFDATGKVCAVALTERDITPRKQREQQLVEVNAELERSKGKFQTLAENVPALFAYIGSDLHYRFVNRRYAELWGRPTADIVGHSVEELLGSQQFENIRSKLEATLAGETISYDATFAFGAQDLEVQVNYVPHRDHHGQVRGFYALIVDITELKKVQLVLANHEQRLSAVVNTAADGIVTMDSEGCIEEFNPAAERMFATTAEAVIGEHINLLIEVPPVETAQQFLDYFLARKGGRIYHDATGQRRDGTHFPLEISIKQIDQVNSYVCLMRDCTERKQLERQIIETSTLEQEHVGREIHDGIGQELTAVTMLAVSLRGQLERTQQADATVAMDGLIEQLQRTLGQAKALATGLSPIVIGPEGLSDALFALVERIEAASGILCRFDLSVSAISIEENAAIHLFRIAQEAVNNAVKHAQASSIEVQLRSDADNIVLSVLDDGIGVPSMMPSEGELGLHLMRYRAGIIGGYLDIRGLADGGTRVQCVMPRKHSSGAASV